MGKRDVATDSSKELIYYQEGTSQQPTGSARKYSEERHHTVHEEAQHCLSCMQPVWLVVQVPGKRSGQWLSLEMEIESRECCPSRIPSQHA